MLEKWKKKLEKNVKHFDGIFNGNIPLILRPWGIFPTLGK